MRPTSVPVPDVTHTDSPGLAAMLALRDAPQPLGGPEEFGAILRHQMQAPLVLDLAEGDKAAAGRLRDLCGSAEPPVAAFGELLRHPRPPVQLLRVAKTFAKAHRNDPESAIPPEVSTVLYFACIAAALARQGEVICGLAPPAMRRGLQWLASRDWAEEATRALAIEALARLDSDIPGAPTQR